MRELKLLFAVIAFFAVSCGGTLSDTPRIITDAEANGLRGPVMEVVEGPELKMTVYNEEGWITEIHKSPYASGGSLQLITKYIYDETDNATLVAIESYSYDDNNKQKMNKCVCSTTPLQRMLDKQADGVEYKYNKDGNLAQTTKYVKMDSDVHRKIVDEYDYNSKKQLVKHVATVYHRTPDNMSADDSDLTQLKYEAKTGNTKIYEYNNEGDINNKILLDFFGRDINSEQFMYKYDSFNNWVSTIGGLKRSNSIHRNITYHK